MDANMIKVKPYKSRYCSRSKANILIDFFESLQEPDRTELRKEANEFREMILKKRNAISHK